MAIKITNITYDIQECNNVISADVEHADGTTTSALEWIADGALVSLDGECHMRVVQGDYYNESEIAEILAAFKSFIAENPTPEFEYVWRSENGSGELSGYTCDKEDLDKALAAFKSELLAGCANKEERENILNGSFLVTHPVVGAQTISPR